MDYKKIFRTRALRNFILSLLRFIPTKIMLRIQYKIKIGIKLNLKNPQRFTEKIQCYKMYYRNPIMHKCVDKYEVREYVSSKGLSNILIPIYGRYKNIKSIEWDLLPNSFVLKTTNGGGGLNVVICDNKQELDTSDLHKKLKCRKFKSNTGGREWAYYGLNPSIVIEELLINKENPNAGINDYKIFCYNGKPKYIIVDVDRYIGHKRNFYDINWNNLNTISDCPGADFEISKPNNLDEMLEIASKLSEDFPFVRVDLYNVDEKIYFGELTFYPWSGYVKFVPDEMDYVFGEDFIINRSINND